MTALTLDRLNKHFGDLHILRDVSIAIAKGEFVSLLGPSGCGKTTTLRCIAGFEQPSSGRILFGSRDVTDALPEKRDIGMVFQSYALFPHMTVAENLDFGLVARKVPPAERARRRAEVLSMVRLDGFEGRFPRELSGGQQQRVALARALVIEPSVLLLDEPLANLDATLRDEMRFFIRELQQRVGITAIYVTHDQAEAMVMSDRIVVMQSGVIAQLGTPREIYERPASLSVAAFIGRSNTLEGTVEGAAGAGLYAMRSGGAVLQAAGPEGLAPGAPVRLLLRPEAVAVGAPDDAAGAGENRIAARIAAAVYQGAAIQLTLETEGGGRLIADVNGRRAVAPGQAVALRFAPADAWLLPA
jgi:putative spermidine/putrescine transport system ATP-binding protein